MFQGQLSVVPEPQGWPHILPRAPRPSETTAPAPTGLGCSAQRQVYRTTLGKAEQMRGKATSDTGHRESRERQTGHEHPAGPAQLDGLLATEV